MSTAQYGQQGPFPLHQYQSNALVPVPSLVVPPGTFPPVPSLRTSSSVSARTSVLPVCCRAKAEQIEHLRTFPATKESNPTVRKVMQHRSNSVPHPEQDEVHSTASASVSISDGIVRDMLPPHTVHVSTKAGALPLPLLLLSSPAPTLITSLLLLPQPLLLMLLLLLLLPVPPHALIISASWLDSGTWHDFKISLIILKEQISRGAKARPWELGFFRYLND
jgi:hypothetical protein